ncbi:MAG: hypothetical protein LBN37_00435, partial [Bacteroidales bacterium]|nr:hypothetical protein [Bacteroidales bacterium]
MAIFVFALAFFSTAALAAPAPFVVKDGTWYRQNNGKLSIALALNDGLATEAGWIYWLFADPDAAEQTKGMERGLYFYDGQAQKYLFLPIAADIDINAVYVSPNGEKFFLESCGKAESNDTALEMYTFKDMKAAFRVGKVVSVVTSPQWIDAGRFIYSRFEPGTSRGLTDDSANEWISLAMYDAIADKEFVLKAATPTANFTFLALSEDGVIALE